MKNKEIEELLNNFQEILDNPTYTDEMYNGKLIEFDRSYDLEQEEIKLLLSYIKQLKECYCNRTDCIGRIKDSKKYDSLLQKYKQLENNKDKAVREIINMIENGNIEFFKGKKLENILMGDSDE